jgi:hypothetical protein
MLILPMTPNTLEGRMEAMPQWLCNQLMRAFHKKDRRQIKMLNDCWFFYQNREAGKANGNHAGTQTRS